MNMGRIPAVHVQVSFFKLRSHDKRTGGLPDQSGRGACQHAAINIMHAAILVYARIESIVYEGFQRCQKSDRRRRAETASPSTPALFPTKLPLLVTLLRMVLRRTRKLGDRRALEALFAAAVAADVADPAVCVGVVLGEAAVGAIVEEADATLTASGLSAAEAEVLAAALACLSVLSRVALLDIGIRLDRAQPSRRPHRPPALKPSGTDAISSSLIYSGFSRTKEIRRSGAITQFVSP